VMQNDLFGNDQRGSDADANENANVRTYISPKLIHLGPVHSVVLNQFCAGADASGTDLTGS
jgi:hypothetical protein